MFNTINIELSSLCNKNCWMCGRRKIEEKYPKIKEAYGFIPFKTLCDIHFDLPEGVLIQFHNNGEPLMYPKLKEALQLFSGNIKCFNTNGILLVERADDIINNLETITISTFENDPCADKQFKIVEEFLKIKGDNKPNVIIRNLGDTKDWKNKYKELGLIVVDRFFDVGERMNNRQQAEFANVDTEQIKPAIPETGICMEMLNKPSIDIHGNMSICVRFDPDGIGIIGNVNKNSITEIWNGTKRTEWLDNHITGKRNIVPLCNNCEYWGIPKGA